MSGQDEIKHTDNESDIQIEINSEQNDKTEVIPIESEDDQESEGIEDTENTGEDKDIDNSEEAPAAPLEKIAKGIFDYVEIFVAAISAVIIMFNFAFRICEVDGPSMENTLLDGESLIVSNLFYEPSYGDIVVFYQTSSTVDRFNEPIVKRVIAKSGDKVYIDFDTWTLYVNDEVVVEDYKTLKGFYTLKADYSFPVEVPQGHIFVMGDNRNNSADSRSSEIGFVDERRIFGRVIFRIAPLDRFGAVK